MIEKINKTTRGRILPLPMQIFALARLRLRVSALWGRLPVS